MTSGTNQELCELDQSYNKDFEVFPIKEMIRLYALSAIMKLQS